MIFPGGQREPVSHTIRWLEEWEHFCAALPPQRQSAAIRHGSCGAASRPTGTSPSSPTRRSTTSTAVCEVRRAWGALAEAPARASTGSGDAPWPAFHFADPLKGVSPGNNKLVFRSGAVAS